MLGSSQVSRRETCSHALVCQHVAGQPVRVDRGRSLAAGLERCGDPLERFHLTHTQSPILCELPGRARRADAAEDGNRLDRATRARALVWALAAVHWRLL